MVRLRFLPPLNALWSRSISIPESDAATGLLWTWDRVYLDRDRALINRSLSVRYGITTPKTKSSRRMIQYGPRVHAELLKQREEFSYAASTSCPTRAAPRPMCAGRRTWCGAGFSRELKFRTDRSGNAVTASRSGAGAAQTAQLDPAADGSSHAANVVETLLALDTDRRSFCRRNVFAGQRARLWPQIMPTLCPPGPKPAPKRARKTMIQISKTQ